MNICVVGKKNLPKQGIGKRLLAAGIVEILEERKAVKRPTGRLGIDVRPASKKAINPNRIAGANSFSDRFWKNPRACKIQEAHHPKTGDNDN